MSPGSALDVVRSAVRATATGPPTADVREAGPRPLVTISRQAGARADPVARRLAELLNERQGGDPPWIDYDRELVERVVADHHLSRDLVARFDERDRSWFEHLTAGLGGEATGTDIAMKIAQSIRGLAWVGRAIIVGRGSQSILAGLGHVVHVRLVAPLEWRVDRLAEREGLSRRDAEQTVRRIDAERTQFVKGHFQDDVSDVTLYDVILNVSRMTPDRAADLLARAVEDLGLDAGRPDA